MYESRHDPALYGGLVAIAATRAILAPIAHRLLHRFHLDDDAP